MREDQSTDFVSGKRCIRIWGRSWSRSSIENEDDKFVRFPILLTSCYQNNPLRTRTPPTPWILLFLTGRKFAMFEVGFPTIISEKLWHRTTCLEFRENSFLFLFVPSLTASKYTNVANGQMTETETICHPDGDSLLAAAWWTEVFQRVLIYLMTRPDRPS